MFGIGLFELLLIIGIILLIAGGRRLPEVGSGLAKAIKGFRRTMRESEEINVTPSRDEAKEGSAPPRREAAGEKSPQEEGPPPGARKASGT